MINWSAILIVIIGIVMVVVGWNGTYGNVGAVFSNTFSSISGTSSGSSSGSSTTGKSTTTVPTTGTQHAAS
jgi:uncharacterized membrane protein